MIADGDEPDLTTGDSGEWVELLQSRLIGLGRLEGPADGSFGGSTAAAVADLQRSRGRPDTGAVDAETWAALAAAELDAGVVKPSAGTGAVSVPPIGTLSEDQHWRWDGDGWERNEGVEAGPSAPAQAGDDSGGQLSADGQWLWDGTQWRAAEP